MAKGTKAAIWGGASVALVLDFCGWVLLLAGVSAMQNSCGGSDANFLLSGGSAGYLAPVSCDRLFAYPWWHTFYNMFVLVMTAVTLAGGLTSFRPGIIALQAISLMQSLETANTWLYFDTLSTSSGTFVARAKVTAAGAIIKSIALFFLIGLVGYRNEESTLFEKAPKRSARVPSATAAPAGPPPSTNVLEPEPVTVAVRPGRVGAAAVSTTAVPPV